VTAFAPPPLRNIKATLDAIPCSELPWIAHKHVQYLDDRIHKIGTLTEYLAGCGQVAKERSEFIDFVDQYTRRPDSALVEYVTEYTKRFARVRTEVEQQCDTILRGEMGTTRTARVAFWEAFAYINEVDSLHGMFLTSGRWYVNVMLPVIKELVFCTLPDSIPDSQRPATAYDIARRIITPQFAKPTTNYDIGLEQRFVKLLIPVLQYYDRKLLFLFEALADTPAEAGESLDRFVRLVDEQLMSFAPLLEMGIYPPFAWHELHSSRRARRPSVTYETALSPLMKSLASGLEDRAESALKFLSIFKEHELNYNNYNYKGRFGLVSKYFYHQTSERLADNNRELFLDAILGDRFFEALEVVKSAPES